MAEEIVNTKVERDIEVVRHVAQNLRRLRLRRGLTFVELAARSGVAKATLTNLEAGRGNPTVETLWSLALALNVPFGALLAEPDQQTVRVIRAGEGETVRSRQGRSSPVDQAERVRLLERVDRRGVVEFFDLTFPAGSQREAEPHNDGVVEHLLVTEGRLRVGPTNQPAILDPGDFIRFPADVPHLYAPLDGPARATLLMDYPPELSTELPAEVPLYELANVLRETS